MGKISSFTGDRSGATAIEYALVAMLISVAIASGATALGVGLSNHFSAVNAAIPKD